MHEEDHFCNSPLAHGTLHHGRALNPPHIAKQALRVGRTHAWLADNWSTLAPPVREVVGAGMVPVLLSSSPPSYCLLGFVPRPEVAELSEGSDHSLIRTAKTYCPSVRERAFRHSPIFPNV